MKWEIQIGNQSALVAENQLTAEPCIRPTDRVLADRQPSKLQTKDVLGTGPKFRNIVKLTLGNDGGQKSERASRRQPERDDCLVRGLVMLYSAPIRAVCNAKQEADWHKERCSLTVSQAGGQGWGVGERLGGSAQTHSPPTDSELLRTDSANMSAV